MTSLYPWQTPLWQRFLELKHQQRIPHAIVLTGVHGLGENEFIHKIASSVLCLSPQNNGDACAQCHSCQLYTAGNHPDHYEIRPEEKGKQIKIEKIRNLKEKQQLTPKVSSWKTVVISPAHSMNISASNSLLKLLEEPERNTLIILVTSKPEVMPITVKSRCQAMHMATPSQDEAINWLQSNHPEMSVEYKYTLPLLKLAKGAPLAVLEMLEQQGTEQYQQIETDFEQLLSTTINPVTLAASWQQYDLAQLLSQLYLNIHQRIVNIYTKDVNSSQTSVNCKSYWKIVDCIMHTTKLISSQNNNNTLLLEEFMVNIMQLTNNAGKTSNTIR